MAAVSFQGLQSSILGLIADEVQDQVQNITDQVQRIVDAETKRAFRLLAKRGVDVAGPPNLGEFTPAWAPLSQKYRKFKQERGMSPNFYMAEGVLQQFLQSQDPHDWLGRPFVTLSSSGTVGRSGVRSASWFNRRLNRVVRQARDERGRFASPKDIYRVVPKSIRVVPFMRVPMTNMESVFEGSANKIYFRFINPYRKKLRPLFENFLLWYQMVHLPNLLNRKIRNV